MFDFSSIGEKDIMAGVLAVSGGILRILLNVDPNIPKWKQFLLLFFAALPVGWMTYNTAIAWDYQVLAFPAGFLSGLMALSMLTIVATRGPGVLWSMLVKGDK